MGSKNRQAQINQNEKLVSVDTADLRQRLNRLYSCIRSGRKSDMGRFDYLWDLKELALMEGRQSVDVPEKWLDELEKGVGDQEIRHGH